MSVPLYAVVIVALARLIFGVFIGVWIANRDLKHDYQSRIVGPGIPTEESEADDFYRKEGWL